MSATEGFWPGDAPAKEEHVQEPEPAPAEPVGWPQQPVDEEPEAEAEAEEELESDAELEPEAMAVAEAAEAQPQAEPEPEPEPEEADEAAREVATAVHVPGELDIPDGVNVLEGSPS